MALEGPACLYQETRLNLDPAFLGSTVDVFLPPNGSFGSSFAARLSPKRRRIDKPAQYSEEVFSKRHLASESSIHFRHRSSDARASHFPRCILWRVLEDRKVLELSSVDLYQDGSQRTDPLLTLRLNFGSALRPKCVAFDSKTYTITLFAITVAGELYTITLPKEAFIRSPGARTEEEVGQDWYKVCKPNAFNYRNPYRLFARTAGELWVSLADGSLVRLEGQSAHTGTQWRESYFTAGGWRTSVRDLISWRSNITIRYGDDDLQPQSAASIDISPDGKHVWAVCLDHTLRAWNIETGKMSFSADLAGGGARDLHRPPERTFDPGHSRLLQFFPGQKDGEYHVVAFSPHLNSFKFRTVRDADSPEHGVVNFGPDFAFAPPVEELADVNLWTLESFFMKHSRISHADAWELWVLARYGPHCKTFVISFDFTDSAEDLERAWKHNWVTVDPGFNTVERLDQHLQNPANVDLQFEYSEPRGLAEQWIEFLFYPGRFTHATLETALAIYLKGFEKSRSSSGPSYNGSTQPLKERICDSVGKHVLLGQNANLAAAYAQFNRDTAVQWHTFYAVVKDLHERRTEPLVLAFDADEDLPWLVHTDCISPIRTCNQVEALWHNREKYLMTTPFYPDTPLLVVLTDVKNIQLGQLFNAISVIRESVSHSFLASFVAAVQSELFQGELLQDGEADPSEQMQSLYDRSGFAGEVGEEDYDKLTDALDMMGGFVELRNQLFLDALEFLGEDQHGSERRKLPARYGAQTLVRGSQETLRLVDDILVDLLLFAVFTSVELETSDLPSGFDAAELFTAVTQKLRQYELLSWCAATLRNDTLVDPNRSILGAANAVATQVPFEPCATVLETIFLGDWAGMHFPAGSLSKQITSWCWIWPFGLPSKQSRKQEFRLKQRDGLSLYIMGNLLGKNDLRLALDFLKFLPETPWAEYLIGRLFLANSDFVSASRYLESAADGLCEHFNVEHSDSSMLLRIDERAYFNSGLALYHQHVLNLFESANAPSYAADFAKLALRALEKPNKWDDNLNTELLSRLFTALLGTCCFQEAFNTLTQYTNLALRKSALQSLIQKILEQANYQTLLSLPYPKDIGAEVDEMLSNLASKDAQPKFSLGIFTDSKASETHAYHKILYAFRLSRKDFRGAAVALWDRLQTLKASQGAGVRGIDVDDEVAQMYLSLINVLALVDPEQAWILTRPLPKQDSVAGKHKPPKLSFGAEKQPDGETPKRKVVTLADVRRMWQDELDRVADLEAGRYPLSFDAMDDEEDVGSGERGSSAMEVDVFAS